MASAPHTIPIRPETGDSAAAPVPGCGACLQGADGGLACRGATATAGAAPRLVGPADDVQRLLAALAPVLGAPESSRLVRALHVQPGEVELQLAVRADCGGAALADRAFQALRSLLPDTDIYVLPAR